MYGQVLELPACVISPVPRDLAAVPASVLGYRPVAFDCDGRPSPTIMAARAAGGPTVEEIGMFAAQAVRPAGLLGAADVSQEEVSHLLSSFRSEL